MEIDFRDLQSSVSKKFSPKVGFDKSYLYGSLNDAALFSLNGRIIIFYVPR